MRKLTFILYTLVTIQFNINCNLLRYIMYMYLNDQFNYYEFTIE